MTAYYNEHDPYAAEWLRRLILNGHIAPGIVDESDIRDIRPDDLKGYTQCHFFAGIGVWSHALRRAGWPDDRPIWTGSCPCQPFSAAGARAGFADERHLWPHWHHLIAECEPSLVLGEQVAGKDGLRWLDLVQDDLEASGYAVGAFDLCAAGFGGPHLRQRLYFIGVGQSYGAGSLAWEQGGPPARQGRSAVAASSFGRMAHHHHQGLEGRVGVLERRDQCSAGAGGMDSGNEGVCHSRQARSLDYVDWLLCRNPAGEPSWRPVEPGAFPLLNGAPSRMGRLRAYGNGLDAETAAGFIGSVMDVLDV